MKTIAPALCLAFVCSALIYIGERSLFFSNYFLFVTIFAALALLVTVIAFWVRGPASSDEKTEQDDN